MSVINVRESRGRRKTPCATLATRRNGAFFLTLFLISLTNVPSMAQGPTASDEAARPADAEQLPSVDPTLVVLRQELDQLLDGTLPKSVEVDALFGIPLHDVDQVSKRVSELRNRIDEETRSLTQLRSRLAVIESEENADVAPVPEPEPAAAEDPANAPEPAIEPLGESAQDPSSVLDTEGRETQADRNRLETERRQRAFEVAYDAWEARRRTRSSRRVDIEAEIPAAASRIDIATKRLAYLEKLALYEKRFSDASRRILPSLRKPRAALRGHADSLASVSAAARDLSRRLGALAERSGSGMIVGFISEQREISAELRAGAAAHDEQANQLESLAVDLFSLADSLEDEGRQVRSIFLRSVALENGQDLLDELFLSHLKQTRHLRRLVNESVALPGRESFERFRSRAEAIAPNPLQIGTTRDANLVLEAAAENRLELDSLVTLETTGKPSWELAFENELMTVLSEQSSEQARADAYRFSREIVDDLTSEASIAWSRTTQAIRDELSSLPTAGELATTPEGQGLLLRSLGVLGLLAAWLYARKTTPKIVGTLVKTLSRVRFLRRRIGRLVRWSGLLQSALPSILALAAMGLALALLGEESAISRLAGIVALPAIIYALGRQLLVGATRRIGVGRPALIELRPPTLERLQRTYANLGIVVAIAYVLDGLTRMAIGAGRFVSLIDSIVLFWIAFWVVWETIRWRVPLAQTWAELGGDADSPSKEGRITAWMEASRLGFILSPIAFARVVATPIGKFLGGVATQTNFVQSLRAQLLRRRSTQSETATSPKVDDLPKEYLDAFPLYPILGEDDALLVAREKLVGTVIDQWRRWQETRGDGSLALIGEKGSGKTTLAAQVACRIQNMTVVQHTVQGKPRDGGALVSELSLALGLEGVRDIGELIRHLCEGDDRVVFIDEVHNVFLRCVDGYRAYDALVELVNATTSKVFWVLVFNSFTWRFLNESRGRVHYFRQVLPIPKWSSEEIEKMIRLRNKKTGYDLRFDEVLLSDARSNSNGFSLVEEADGYFRLLWESSGGNPRIAAHLWLSSLRLISEKTLGVGLFSEPSVAVLSDLQDELVFCLAAICQHENLSHQELALVLNTSDGFARFAIQFLNEAGFIEPKASAADRSTLGPKYYRAVLRSLRNKHLLFE